jgi:DNA-binding NarL/FixJ family response regulator
MPARVLIVDDHASFRSVASRLLAAGGFAVVGEAIDGAGALRAARDLRPDVVLLDIQLPDLDGFVVAELLVEGAFPPAVVLVSSRSRTDYGTRVGDSSARGFIPKAELSGDAVRLLLGTGPGLPVSGT